MRLPVMSSCNLEFGGYIERRNRMTQGLRAQESTLADLLRPGVEMSMPPYQRSYSWDKEEAQELLSDLLQASESGNAHFIGAIVLVREAENGLLIVDGQQRLTTLTIILAALRDLESDKKRAEQLHALIADDKNGLIDNGVAWRISLNHVDGAYFRAAVQVKDATTKQEVEENVGDSESQKRMATNTKALFDRLNNLSTGERRKLADTIQTRLALVKVTVEDWDGGYTVFKVLNTRGKAPNSHDIIKTDLLERSNLSINDANTFSRQWSEHEARLGGSGFDELLSQIRVLYDRNADTGPTGFRKAVLGRANARDFLANDLPGYVDAYVTISKGDPNFGELNDLIRVPLNHLRLIDHHLWRAPALRFLVTHKGDPKVALDFFTRLERYAFAMMMIVPDRKQRLKRYGRIADIVEKPNSLLSNRGPMALTRDEGKKIYNRLLGRFGSFSQRRAIALRLNAAIEGGRPLSPDIGATVEHVLPRNLPDGSTWHNTWPVPSQHRELCETIGNFVLLSQNANQKADVGSFEDKKTLYFQNGDPEYALTRDLNDQVAWTPETVRTRTQQLANILMQSWGFKI